MDIDVQDVQMDVQRASQDQPIEIISENGASSDIDLVDAMPKDEQSLIPDAIARGSTSVDSILSFGRPLRPDLVKRHGIAVVVYPVERPWEYRPYTGPAVSEIVERYDDGGLIEYLVRYEDEDEEVVSH